MAGNDDEPLWTHKEHMDWGQRMFVNGFNLGVAVTVLCTVFAYFIFRK